MNLKGLQKVIEDIGKGIPPKDDWVPTLIVEGKKEVCIYGFLGDPMGNSNAKDQTAKKMKECIAEFKPDLACFISTAWLINFEKGKWSNVDLELYRAGLVKVSEHPDRIEIVSAYVYAVRGPLKGETFMIGNIERHPDSGPSVKEWKMHKKGTTAEGRFPDAIKEGFKLAKGGK